MAERSVTVASSVGLHARPASLFSQAASRAGVRVTLAKDGRAVDAASILSILSLGVDHGDVVVLSAEGDGADAAVESLARMLETDLDQQ